MRTIGTERGGTDAEEGDVGAQLVQISAVGAEIEDGFQETSAGGMITTFLGVHEDHFE